jgi:hypothetical protein
MKTYKDFISEATYDTINLSDTTNFSPEDQLYLKSGLVPYKKENGMLVPINKTEPVSTKLYYTDQETVEKLNNISKEIISLESQYDVILKDKVKTR